MSNHREILIFDNIDGMGDFIVKRWRELAERAMREKGFFAVALSGGRTPVDFYRRLAEPGAVASWEKTHIFLVDERFVPFMHGESNYGMIARVLLCAIDIPVENLHPVPVDEASPKISAERYEEEMREFFGLAEGEVPEFDLILLGIGEDGHAASLFSGDPALKERERLATAVVLDEARYSRITLTLPVINGAGNVIFLVTGRSKAGVLKKVLEGEDPSLPASLVRPSRGNLSFVVDGEAASLLSIEMGKRI